jgi:anaerobic ribonucleoside-triphosphate reductase activating protein
MFERTGGTTIERLEIPDDVEGISILGGEPLEQIEGVTALAEEAQRRGLGVILYSGYALAEAQDRPGFERLWAAIDTLVDGRFDARRLDHERAFVGSTNQRLQHRTERYAEPGLWRGRERAEIHVDAVGGISIHGAPARARRIDRAISLTSPRWRSRRPSSGS